MSKDYGSWSLPELKCELRKRNAKVTGKKALLVQRLEDYDKLFGPLITDPQPVFKINIPSPEKFKDVTSATEVPILDRDDLKKFCAITEREDIKTSQNMYEDKFLISCRLAESDGYSYVTGLCASEMRKNITYNVTLKLKNHMIIEAQCECAAGIGPNCQCKHAMVLIFGILAFNETKTINLKSSCTSQLQTFHQPTTSYTGDPVLAENLKLRSQTKKMGEMVTFDPRPNVEDKEKYNQTFKNLIANYQSNSPMPITQILKPADKKSIFNDHNYLEMSAEDNFFQSLLLSQDQLLELQKLTDEKEWLKVRKLRLQSSDFGKICKRKSNKCELARELLKNNQINAPALNHGKKYENEALKKFQEITGLFVSKCGIIVHPIKQFLGCTPDALVENNKILEIKCPYTARFKNISTETVPYIYLCETSGEFKLNKVHDYYYQIQGQLYCTRCDLAYLFIYTINDFCLIKIERDEMFINDMIGELESYYKNYYKRELLNRYLYR